MEEAAKAPWKGKRDLPSPHQVLSRTKSSQNPSTFLPWSGKQDFSHYPQWIPDSTDNAYCLSLIAAAH